MGLNSSERKRDGIIQLVAILLVVLFILFSFWRFNVKSQKSFTEASETQLREVAEFNVTAIESELNSALNTIKLIASSVSNVPDFLSDRAVNRISNVVDASPFSKIYIGNIIGEVISDKGEKMLITDRDFLYRMRAGKDGISDLIIANETYEKQIVVYSPIRSDSGEIIGVVFGIYEMARIMTIVSLESFSGASYAYLIESDGKVIASDYGGTLVNNVLTALSDCEIRDVPLSQIENTFAVGKEINFEYVKENEDYIAYCLPVGVNYWYICEVIPKSVIISKVKTETANVMVLVICLTAGLAVILVGIIYYGRKYRREVVNTNKELSISSEWLKIAMRNFDHGVFEYDFNRNVIMNCTNSFETFGNEISPDQLVIDGYIAPSSKGKYLELFADIKTQDEVRGVVEIRDEDKTCYEKLSMKKVYDDDGIPVRAIGTVEDVTELHSAEEKFKEEAAYRETIMSELMCIVSINIDRDEIMINYSNMDGVKITGTPLKYSSFNLRIAQNLVYAEDRTEYSNMFSLANMSNSFKKGVNELKFVYRRKFPDGEYRYVQSTGHILVDPTSNELKCFVYIKDVNEQKQKELQLFRASTHDPLTDLYNRARAESRIKETLNSSDLTKNGVHGLMIIDIDNFKSINDTLGHAVGDYALQCVANSFRENFRMSDVYARLGGDEFIAFVKDADSEKTVVKKAEELRKAVNNIVIPNHENVKITVSAGVVIIRNFKYSYEELYKMADTALYKAKTDGKNMVGVFGFDKLIGEDAEFKDIK